MAIIPLCWQSYCIPTGELNGHDKHELSVYLWSVNDYSFLKCLPMGIKVQEGNVGWTPPEVVRDLLYVMILSRLNLRQRKKQPVLKLKLRPGVTNSKSQMMQWFKNRRKESGIWKLVKSWGRMKEEHKTNKQGNSLVGKRTQEVIVT